MQELTLYLTQFVLAYLLLGCALVLAITFFIHWFPLNAASRHRIWLAGLVVLALAPALSLYPQQTDSNIHDKAVVVNAKVSAFPAREPGSEQGTDGAEPLIQQVTKLTLPAVEEGGSFQLGISATDYSPLASMSAVFVKLPVYRTLLFLFGVLYLVGVLSKLLTYVRSMQSLKKLLESSEPVSSDWQVLLDACAARLDVGKEISLRQSERLGTPSTCGILRPSIILPATMNANEEYLASRSQILEHELAHVKRNDLLVAGFQAVVHIFLFWHPAVHYLNRQIRHERELACDDWVLNSKSVTEKAGVAAYAYGMISIAESMQSRRVATHTVACVNNSKELRERIECLFDDEVDHSTSVSLTPNTLAALVFIAFLFLATDLFPKLPEALLGLEQGPWPTDSGFEADALPASILWSTRSTQPRPAADTVGAKNGQLLSYVLPSELDELIDLPEQARFATQSGRMARFANPEVGKREGAIHAEASHSHIRAFIDASTNGLVDELVSASDTYAGDNNPSDLIDIDSLSRSQLRKEMQKIELELYRVFNQLTDRDDLRVHCAEMMPLGTYIKRLSCEPEFIRTARSESLGDAIIRSSSALLPTWAGIDRHLDFNEFAVQLVKEMESSDYLRELYRVLVDLRARYAEVA